MLGSLCTALLGGMGLLRCCKSPQFSVCVTWPRLFIPPFFHPLPVAPLPSAVTLCGDVWCWQGGRRCRRAALVLAHSAIFHHTENETTRSSPGCPAAAWQGLWGLQLHAHGKMCVAGSEEITLDATWCPAVAWPVPGARSPKKSQQSWSGWRECRV